MRWKEWAIVFLPLIATLAVDQVTKFWALDLTGTLPWGPLLFALHFNPGAMLGLFSELPSVLRVVTLSTAGSLLLVIYGLIQYLLPIKSLVLRIGLSILIGGILGNVLDRILFGHVTDFIIINLGGWLSPVFNLADVLQWVGYALIVWAIIKEGDLLWPANDARKRKWINLRFQLRYSFFLAGMGLGFGVICFVFSYTYLKVILKELIGANPIIFDRFLIPYALTFGLLTLGICIGLFTLGKIISHKIAGPVYAFEKFIDDLASGKNRAFKLRAHDEFKHLEILAKKMQESLQAKGALSTQVSELSPEEAALEGAQLAEQAEKALRSKV